MKIEYDYLSVEITRRCNLQCAHCLRGDAQNKDMSKGIIDKILDRTASIDTLLFTGGEPTLNIDGMRYFLEGLKARGIPLNLLSIVTNGIIQSDDLICLYKDYDAYINQVNTNAGKKIGLSISKDAYHKTDTDSHIKYWKNTVGDFVAVIPKYTGDAPNRDGNAKQLKYRATTKYHPHTKIAYFTEDKPDFICEQRENYVPVSDTMRIADAVTVSVDGLFFDVNWSEYDSQVVENSIYSIDTDDIVSAIDRYNLNKPYRRIALEASSSRYNTAQMLKQDNVYRILYLIALESQNEGFGELTKPKYTKTKEQKKRAYVAQFDNSTDAEIVNAIYQTHFADKAPDELTQDDCKVINSVYAQLEETYKKYKNETIQH